MGLIKENGLINSIWSYFNKILYLNSSSIITISEGMSQTISKYCPHGKQIHVIHNWVDTNFIFPIEKENNWFAKKYNQVSKITVLYSGNLGASHDFMTLLESALILKGNTEIFFIIIGEGAQKKKIDDFIKSNYLSNVLTLPLQDAKVLPYSLSTTDIGVVTLDEKVGLYSVPSKTYYMMAAGSVILGFGSNESELARLIRKYDMGANFSSSQAPLVSEFLLDMTANKRLLQKYKDNSRKASLEFSNKNATEYYSIINKN
jgi:glycosyltransferase involved in cell wall biosynthesis